MEFFGYDTCDKSIGTSVERSKSTNKIKKKGIPIIYINKISPSSTWVFGCYPHKKIFDTLSEYLVSFRFKAYSSKNEGFELRYKNKVKYRHGIGIPKKCGYQGFGDKTGFNFRSIFA